MSSQTRKTSYFEPPLLKDSDTTPPIMKKQTGSKIESLLDRNLPDTADTLYRDTLQRGSLINEHNEHMDFMQKRMVNNGFTLYSGH